MQTIVVTFFLAVVAALLATPLARRLAFRLQWVDHPHARKMHRAPMPLMGGLALYAAVCVAVMLIGRHYFGELIVILLGASAMALLGLIDDRLHLHWLLKLAAQALVVTGLYAAGVRVQLDWLPGYLNALLSVGWMLGILNAMNLLDNMDGLSAGVSAVASAFFTVLAAVNGQLLVSAMAAAMTGACVGFLFFNAKPARIFMGDAGSLFLGLMLAVIGIKLRFPENTNRVTWLVPILVLAVPIADTTLVMFSRLRRGLNPLATPGKDHLSHRLHARGYTERESVMILMLAGTAYGLTALWVSFSNVTEGLEAGAVALVTTVVLMIIEERKWRQRKP